METNAILKYLSNNNMDFLNKDDETPIRAKKRRLDHLSWEEKQQRKKLKNRVAAQTSRDRKKAKMEQMESALRELFSKNEAILAECENLKAVNKRLTEENVELHNRLKAPCVTCSQNRSVECETVNGSTESLLQLKGTVTHSAAALDKQATMALWKIVMACLLYQTSSTNSTTMLTSVPLSNSLKASCKISPEIWKLLLKRQIIKNQAMLNKTNRWWGRHQKNWNPLEVQC